MSKVSVTWSKRVRWKLAEAHDTNSRNAPQRHAIRTMLGCCVRGTPGCDMDHALMLLTRGSDALTDVAETAPHLVF